MPENIVIKPATLIYIVLVLCHAFSFLAIFTTFYSTLNNTHSISCSMYTQCLMEEIYVRKLQENIVLSATVPFGRCI